MKSTKPKKPQPILQVDGTKAMPLSDAGFRKAQNTINNAIHELVFACNNLDHDDLSGALVCLTTAHFSLGLLQERLENLRVK